MGKGGDRVDSVFKKPVKAPKTLEKILVGVLSATPLSPVRFRSSPLRKNHVYVVLFILVKNKKQGEAIP